jgi:curved DNA-binding protein CbpA
LRRDRARHRRSAIARSDVLIGTSRARMLEEVKAVSNLYEALGISPAARTPEIKAAFRRLAKSSHPDFNTDDTTANQRFQIVHLAYRVLCDTEMRADYDRYLQCLRFLDATRARPVPRWRRVAREVTLVTAMVIGITPIFVLGLKMVALDRLAVIVSQWGGEPQPPPADARRLLAGRLHPSETQPAAIEPAGTGATEPPPTETPNGADASLSGLLLAALLPDRAVSAPVDGAKGPAPADAPPNRRAPLMTLSADMPDSGDPLPPAPGRAADVASALADRGTLDQARRLLGQGERYAAEGNIAVARQYFVRAADLGLAIAATKMAETFEADMLARRGVRGVKPDPAEAVNWRRRARELDRRQSESTASGVPE